ncbi:outer membrane beta-barrel protein [Telmatobacter sp. DSM 110680]|uniref:Outer membrane beta-barrel protein n=1 Tax=Telmatobacter sp. DSM 110680 TaxID=3036704 RepID=A0AAU7DEX4_9BACT
MSISLKLNRIILQSLVAASLATAIAGAQAPATVATAAPPATTPATPAAATDPAPEAAPAPTALSTFVLTGPLQWLPPATFDAGPLGKLSVNGIITGFSQFQSNHVPGDDAAQATLSNGQIFIQKADGKVQYYIQAGVYTMQALSVPFTDAQTTVKNTYGPVPVAYLKLQAGKNTQFLIGSLPTLMGAESTFTYQNFNIERGIVWNQENAINKGIQINQTLNKYLSASVSWNDGYYSNRYSWLSGSVTLTKGPHVLVYDGMGNLGQTVFETAATPIQNNGYMHAVIYTYTKGPWIISPYFQYGKLPTNAKVGVVNGTSATGGALNVSYAFKSGFSLPARVEYLTSSGSATDGSVNMLGFGAGSSGTTFTATPTYQKGGMYVRGDLAWVHATDYTPGSVFGSSGTNADQFRGALEFGFIFGKNVTEK